MKNIVHIGAGGERAPEKNTTYHYFEPRDDNELSKVSIKDNVNVYPFALSDFSGNATLNITKKKSCSSFLEPNIELLKKLQPKDWQRFEVQNRVEVRVERLDNLLDSDIIIDLLIIDTQGSELSILKGAGELLYKTKKIICEAEFLQLYEGQPLFKDIEDYLIEYGFVHEAYVRKVHWNEKAPVFVDAVFKNKNSK